MVTFYTAIGSFELRMDGGRRMPYILHLGRYEPVSIPEFFIWSHLLWEVETYSEIRAYYLRTAAELGIRLPDFDQGLKMLVDRKLVAKGVGYTGEDALFDMLSSAFVIPVRLSGGKKFGSVIRMFLKGRITLWEAGRILRPKSLPGEERRVLSLVQQTPLSVSELIRCFDSGVMSLNTPDEVISAIYTDEEDDQERIRKLSRGSGNRAAVLQATANLYLNHKVRLDMA